jgi:hypothetical protein
MSGFQNYDYSQAQSGAEDSGASNPAQQQQQQQPSMAQSADNSSAQYQSGGPDAGAAGGAQHGDAKTTLWCVQRFYRCCTVFCCPACLVRGDEHADSVLSHAYNLGLFCACSPTMTIDVAAD